LPRIDWRTALRALLGFLAGLALWVALSPLYTPLVAGSAARIIRLFERPPVTNLTAIENGYVSLDRSDFDRRSKHPAVSVDDLTFNVILLTALFAAGRARPFSDRNMIGFFLACAVLALTHVAALISEVMSIYTSKLGMWSELHYGTAARNFWTVASHSYRVVLMYAIAFGLWWIFRDTRPVEAKRKASPASKAKKKRR
jgi:hypothetical protein